MGVDLNTCCFGKGKSVKLPILSSPLTKKNTTSQIGEDRKRKKQIKYDVIMSVFPGAQHVF